MPTKRTIPQYLANILRGLQLFVVLYRKSLFALTGAAIISVQLRWFPETPEQLSGDLEVWRGLPTAVGLSLLTINLVVALAYAISVWRSRPTRIG